MRYVGDISSTDHYKIALYTWNGKYIVKVEAGLYEQTYKVSEMDFLGDEADIHKLFSDEAFLKTIFARFNQMHTDFQEAIERVETS
ncbi:hypothetical protein [Runella salmonicolor]|uniref:GSKIP domain-containing protein n=1 Tax=Runella salmonicolor TaxID=2950278 RepID=A0ABT1FM14_9BACT|nr:hypothetical protein [Runella salmonicolor]MCP1381557.1 hypothetical protein [Runella salmonicolor]